MVIYKDKEYEVSITIIPQIVGEDNKIKGSAEIIEANIPKHIRNDKDKLAKVGKTIIGDVNRDGKIEFSAIAINESADKLPYATSGKCITNKIRIDKDSEEESAYGIIKEGEEPVVVEGGSTSKLGYAYYITGGALIIAVGYFIVR